ncbi:hypothetical protein F8M41_000557 [Gigaspora margarita]|uniref:Uncharacterized protein n=1 Tax=Gigaspora margarita TaxID=4874 RepID=A0A8H3XIW8_GIGMA|nr:hypothetical protein F8M41_000557 [Gigaspora margarita]
MDNSINESTDIDDPSNENLKRKVPKKVSTCNVKRYAKLNKYISLQMKEKICILTKPHHKLKHYAGTGIGDIVDEEQAPEWMTPMIKEVLK